MKEDRRKTTSREEKLTIEFAKRGRDRKKIQT
jgi:hypothetical protein